MQKLKRDCLLKIILLLLFCRFVKKICYFIHEYACFRPDMLAKFKMPVWSGFLANLWNGWHVRPKTWMNEMTKFWANLQWKRGFTFHEAVLLIKISTSFFLFFRRRNWTGNTWGGLKYWCGVNRGYVQTSWKKVYW